MGRHNDTNKGAVLGKVLVWTVVEFAADSTLGTSELLIGRQVQASLDISVIEYPIVFAARDIREVSHIRDHRPRTILAIQACAAVRGLISPVQPGRTRKISLCQGQKAQQGKTRGGGNELHDGKECCN